MYNGTLLLLRLLGLGDVLERMVQIIKCRLKNAVRHTLLSNAEMQTVLTDVEVTLNNRPMTYIDTDSLGEVSTPDHVSHGRSMPVVSTGSIALVLNANTKKVIG